MFWIILAAQISMPVALGVPIPDVRAVFSSDDMPAYVQIAGVTRFVFTRTTVRADGTPQDCTAETASGDPKLDAYTCAIIVKRARFEPAKWVDGSPAYAILRVPVIWAIGGAPAEGQVEKAYPPDIALTVNRLPRGAGKRAELALMLAVDETGRVVSCDQWLPASKHFHAKTFPELLPLACQQMTRAFTAQPAKDASGKPVRSVQSASVVFSTGS
jgi:hypothetical protein